MAASPTTRDKFSTSSCRTRLSKKMAPPPLPQPMRPTFHPATALFRLRPSDFGFLQMAEFLPADFSLVLASPLYSLTVGSKAICNVLTSCLFTDSIQANIKFSIKNHHSKEAVLFCKEDCRVSPDLKTFQLAFPLHQPGTYTLTVLLYEQHIAASPLSLAVTLPGSQGPHSPFSPVWDPAQKQLEHFHIPSPLLSNPLPRPPSDNSVRNANPPPTIPATKTLLPSEKERQLAVAPKDFCPPMHSTSKLGKALDAIHAPGLPKELAEDAHQKDEVEHLLRGQGDGGEASRPTSRPVSPLKSPSLESGDDHDLTRRVLEISIEENEDGEIGDRTRIVDPDMAVERGYRKGEKQGSKASSVAIEGKGGRLTCENQASKYMKSTEVNFRKLREGLEEDLEKLNKASRPQKSAPAVKGISRCSDPPPLVGRQFAKGPTPPSEVQCQEGPTAQSRSGNKEARHIKFPAASTVRPSPPLASVDLPLMLSSRPAGRTAISTVTMCLSAPKLRQHSPESIHGPIGICLLRDKCVVVSSTFEDQVKMFTGCGQFLRIVEAEPGRGFKHPSDLVALKNGGFAVRDQLTVRIYDRGGRFQRRLDPTYLDRFFGLAEDNEGRLVTINENKGGRVREKNDGTRPGESDLLFFNLTTGCLVKRVELGEVIADKERSKCRFLTRGLKGSLVITDLGMDRVYILDLATKGVSMFGHSGSGPGCFKDPAGLAVDSMGNMLIADSRNHRLCLHDFKGRFLTEVKLDPPPKRPSGLLLDQENGDIYILNLQGDAAVIRYSLQAE